MTTPRFTWTDRARPVIQIGIGSAYDEVTTAQWDTARWDTAGDEWGGNEPEWRDVTCDSFTARCEYGRQRTTDRFVVGQASVVVWNATGWADPNATDEPGTLTMRPGRPIRFGVQHVAYGTRWIFRGFIDALTPVYDPTQPDTVELSCVDALGEVNRAKTLPLDAPMWAGDTVDQRIGRLLDLASWPTSKRVLTPTGDTLIASDLGGQLADLLGQAADSGGGNVFGDLDANVAYKPRDWQTFAPGTPPDGTIGNVEQGHTIPGVPQVDGYLNLTAGNVSTVDSPNMGLDGKFRLTVRARLVTLPASGFPLLLGKTGAGTANREFMIYITAPSGGMSFSTARVGLAANTDGTVKAPPLPLGEDHTYGFEATPGSTAYTAIFDAIRTNGTLTSAPAFPDSTAPVAVGQIVAGFTGRIYWAEMLAINRARLVFPGIAGNYLSVPDAAPLDITGDIEIVVRLAPTTWRPSSNRETVNKYATTGNQRSYRLALLPSGAPAFYYSLDGIAGLQAAPGAVIPNDALARWLRVTRVAATGASQFYTAPDAPTEPTSWTTLGAAVPGTAGNLFPGTAPLWIGSAAFTTTDHYSGRIMRVIVRNGIAGTTVLDVSENNAGTMATGTTFVATTGQTVTVTQTAGNTIVQPQPNAVVWRFDANDYPGTGTTYVDPRGRTWTLSTAGAIVAKVPNVPPVVVPPDVCPVQWERPFARADMATRVIIGRDLATAQQLDDLDGQGLYGIEPFERTDLLTADDDRITMLGERVLRVRSALAAPRIRSVTIDARTSDAALDLMSTVDVYKPSRYRCRLQYPEPRGLVFDAEHIATGVVHEMTPSSWAADVNLDLAAPFEAPGGRWDSGRWDQATWAAPV